MIRDYQRSTYSPPKIQAKSYVGLSRLSSNFNKLSNKQHLITSSCCLVEFGRLKNIVTAFKNKHDRFVVLTNDQIQADTTHFTWVFDAAYTNFQLRTHTWMCKWMWCENTWVAYIFKKTSTMYVKNWNTFKKKINLVEHLIQKDPHK